METEQISEKSFFAASNSSHGFQNYYPSCFGEGSPVERLFIIKGGPGTGKSYFMRSVGRAAAAHGYDVTHYYCSSDPSSLDGVICCKEGHPCIGVIDGTAPHVCEPQLPGVREEIINLGAFWDSRQLIEQADTVKTLCEQKSECYATAYHLLAASGEADAVIDVWVRPCVQQKKIERLAERILKDQPMGKSYHPIPALLDAVGMTGVVHFDTYGQMSDAHRVYVEDYHGVGYRVMEAILHEAEQKKLDLLVAPHPVHTHKVTAIYLPSCGLSVMVKDAGEVTDVAGARLLTLRRYVDGDAMRAVRRDLRQTEIIRDSLLEGAVAQLKKAAVHHFALEKIYSAAMDFSAKGAFEQEFCRKLFAE